MNYSDGSTDKRHIELGQLRKAIAVYTCMHTWTVCRPYMDLCRPYAYVHFKMWTRNNNNILRNDYLYSIKYNMGHTDKFCVVCYSL